ncbi:MAG: glutathione S-transferase family protein [Methylophilaceae bacterium]
MLQIYGSANTRSTRATWALEEAGAEYEFISIDFSKGEHRSQKLLSANPNGKVPTLIDGDFILAESAAICTYIGEKFPASHLVPTNLQERASYLQWCFFVMSELETPLWNKLKYTTLYPEQLRVPNVVNTCLWEFERAAKILTQHLEGREYVVGEQFSAADIMVSLTLGWAQKSDVTLNATLESYAQRLWARPALAKARARESSAA